MNQRAANRSRHAAVLSRQLVECRNSGGVAKDNGDLPALVAQGCLALRTGLGLAHSSRQLAHEVKALAVGLPLGQLGGNELATVPAGGLHGKDALSHCDTNQLAAGLFLQGGSKVAGLGKCCVHLTLPSGPIPPMGESYAVTSDVSTLSMKIALEAA
jgi:hypothetical protein